ncbi:hypothetical protein Ciccas_004985 [Cichlidogyrus casuarinus]|uniref:Uncharacterized protein n=1 Tax=Cichlidogyrus casuarinus TaxID=1844966 RepID=A0ABD2Q9X6_9PLAT
MALYRIEIGPIQYFIYEIGPKDANNYNAVNLAVTTFHSFQMEKCERGKEIGFIEQELIKYLSASVDRLLGFRILMKGKQVLKKVLKQGARMPLPVEDFSLENMIDITDIPSNDEGYEEIQNDKSKTIAIDQDQPQETETLESDGQRCCECFRISFIV